MPNKDCLVLDPFCGSGTVLLEAILSGHNSIGCDANPLARIIAKVKTNPIDPDLLRLELTGILGNAKRLRKGVNKNIINVDHWFPAHVQRDLGRISRAIDKVSDASQRDFFRVVFSSIVKKSSFSDPNLSVPVKIKPEKYRDRAHREKAEKLMAEISNLDVFNLFEKQSNLSISRIAKLYKEDFQVSAKVVGTDARSIGGSGKNRQPDCSVDLIITSPPYSGAQKYIRSSSLSLGWLDYCEENTLRYYEKKNIGREHYSVSEYKSLIKMGIGEIDEILEVIREKNPLRAHISGNYLFEMSESLLEMYRVLKFGKYCVIVIGNNEVCGLKFETQSYIRMIAEKVGFTTCLVLIDDIQSRGLMTKRNKTASIINSEWVLVLRK